MPSAPQGLEQLARHIQRPADYPTVAIGGISLGKGAGGTGDRRRQHRGGQRHHPVAADWRAATDQLLALAGAGDE